MQVYFQIIIKLSSGGTCVWGVFVSASLFGGNQLLLIFFYYSELSISVRSNISGEGRWDSECSLGNSFSWWCCKCWIGTAAKTLSWCTKQITSEGRLTEAKINQGLGRIGFTVKCYMCFKLSKFWFHSSLLKLTPFHSPPNLLTPLTSILTPQLEKSFSMPDKTFFTWKCWSSFLKNPKSIHVNFELYLK